MEEKLRKAYKTLGLPEDASKQQVEDRYTLSVRREKARSRQRQDAMETNETYDFEQISAAYHTIRNHLEELEDASNPFVRRMRSRSPWVQKLDHFWNYYKLHTLVAIVFVVVVGYIIQGIADHQREKSAEARRPPIDVEIMLFGKYFMGEGNPDFTPMESNILALMPEWKRVKSELIYSPLDAKDQFDIAAQQKSIVALATTKPDLYISDKANFMRLANQGVYQPLDPYETKLKNAVGESRLIYAESKDTQGKHLFGVDITNSDIFHGLNITGNEKIIGIRSDTKRGDKAAQFILKLAETMK